MFDLTSLALRADTTLQLKHPVTDELLFEDADAKTIPVTISLHGSASKQYRNALASSQGRTLKRQQRGEKVDVATLLKEGMDLLVACSVTSTLEREGAPVDNADAFRAMYLDPQYSWVKDQVEAATADVANFLQ